jgi:hypothetical protein
MPFTTGNGSKAVGQESAGECQFGLPVGISLFDRKRVEIGLKLADIGYVGISGKLRKTAALYW